MNIVLVGMMGSGKTSIGKKIAKLLSFRFVDTDLYIEELQGKSVPVLFKEKGELWFRDLENKCLKEILSLDNVVISTGGGLPCYHNNMDKINKNARSVYLEANPAFLKSRLINNKYNRPLISSVPDEDLENYLEEMLNYREKYYRKADLFVNALGINAKTLLAKIEEK